MEPCTIHILAQGAGPEPSSFAPGGRLAGQAAAATRTMGLRPLIVRKCAVGKLVCNCIERWPIVHNDRCFVLDMLHMAPYNARTSILTSTNQLLCGKAAETNQVGLRHMGHVLCSATALATIRTPLEAFPAARRAPSFFWNDAHHCRRLPFLSACAFPSLWASRLHVAAVLCALVLLCGEVTLPLSASLR